MFVRKSRKNYWMNSDSTYPLILFKSVLKHKKKILDVYSMVDCTIIIHRYLMSRQKQKQSEGRVIYHYTTNALQDLITLEFHDFMRITSCFDTDNLYQYQNN